MKKAVIVALFLACTGLLAAGETRPAKLLPDQPHPPFPDAAWKENKEGTVRFKARIAAAGSVEEIEILEVPERGMGFEDAVREAVLTWRFEPALHDGEPVPWFHTGTIEFVKRLPRALARMYDEHPDAVWEAVLSILQDARIKTKTVNAPDGFIITKPKKIGKPPNLDVAMPKLSDSGWPMKVTYRIYIPLFLQPARVYVDAIVVSGVSAYYETLVPENWMLDHVDKRLGERGHAIPMSGKYRRKLIEELVGEATVDACLPVDTPLLAGAQDAQRIEESYYAPLYPEPDRLKRKSGKMTFNVQLWEDGTVHNVTTVQDTTGAASIPIAARQAARLWRYRPARRKDGCPVSIDFFIHIVFTLR